MDSIRKICPKCNRLIVQEFQNCYFCGYDYAQGITSETSDGFEKEIIYQGLKCARCGSLLVPGISKCGVCGCSLLEQSIYQEEDAQFRRLVKRCKICGIFTLRRSRYCLFCDPENQVAYNLQDRTQSFVYHHRRLIIFVEIVIYFFAFLLASYLTLLFFELSYYTTTPVLLYGFRVIALGICFLALLAIGLSYLSIIHYRRAGTSVMIMILENFF